MRILREPLPLAEKILGPAQVKIGQMCRRLTYTASVPYEDGTLLYNVMNRALVLLTREETALLDALPAELTPALAGLAERWFLTAQENDDRELCDGMKAVARALTPEDPRNHTNFTVVTTTDCNARCFYCFEAGARRVDMSEQTAHDAAAFILRRSGGEKVRIHWFGGEPMMNPRVMDIISADLRAAGKEFASKMTSNGYLFDEAPAVHAREQWNLEHIQITLDGTREQYNRRKAYVRPAEDPYGRVLRNVDHLLKAGIRVSIRLNVEPANIQDMRDLCAELNERFHGRKRLHVYIARLFENTGTRPVRYDEESRELLEQNCAGLIRTLREYGLNVGPGLPYNLSLHQCMADYAGSVMIQTDGRLGLCEHYCDSEIFGSIYSDDIDLDFVSQWQELRQPFAQCGSCFHYPDCVRLVRCPSTAAYCPERRPRQYLEGIRDSMLRTCEHILSRGSAAGEEPEGGAAYDAAEC